MSGPWHPTGRGRVSQRRPEALGVCDQCGFTYNLRELKWQLQWQGMQLQRIPYLVCDTCWDTPQEQLRTIILPPDPVPVDNPRPENYTFEVPSYISELSGVNLVTMAGVNLITMIEVTPNPDPNAPILIPPDF